MRYVTAYRKGAIAVAAGFLLVGLAATSAAAEELPETPADYEPVIVIDRTGFVAGAWGDGFDVAGSGFIPNSSGYVVYGRITPETVSSPAEVFETDDNGMFQIHVDPSEPATADSPDQTAFVVRAQQPGPGFFVRSDWLTLTIAAPAETEAPTEPAEVPPAEVPPAEAVTAPASETGNQLAETGFDGTIGIAALALVASGAAVMLRRRTAPAPR
ncbi:hypothetical protein [Agromyces cerinus]|uniref:LPXTG-motif cell wall anchor domain-containing protein n=1 Tax=Agromyces cerinus subsp. cerinus TaxID=232089 RepID=A0A1N6ERL3_9MICO|nr:hypothetical protein [Agromyces cerinus]SIN85686.1 hypothetical protein SAMN05443544_1399 [Agromyces cerinus subsp. cerinus]